MTAQPPRDLVKERAKRKIIRLYKKLLKDSRQMEEFAQIDEQAGDLDTASFDRDLKWAIDSAIAKLEAGCKKRGIELPPRE